MNVNPSRVQRLRARVSVLERLVAARLEEPKVAQAILVHARLVVRELEIETGDEAVEVRERAAGVVKTVEWALNQPDAAQDLAVAI